MRPAENIDKLIKRLHLKASAELDERVESEISKALGKVEGKGSAALQPNAWRIIMKSRITKLATAAAIILIAGLGITILDKSVPPVWAIEDTAEALDQFNAVYISGVVGIPIEKFGGGEDLVLREGEKMSVEIWAQANEERTQSGNIRMETGDGAVGAVYVRTTYRYDPENNMVEIKSGQEINLSPWPCGEFLLRAQEAVENWRVMYGKDAATGRDYAFITCSNLSQRQSWWLEIDLETNLPVRAKGWNNTRREGTPSMDLQRIVFFRELPDEMFEFEIPKGAEVVDWREQFKEILKDRNYGMSAEGLTKENCCKRIVEEYWQAMIKEDWEKARRLRGFPDGQVWEDWKAQYYDNMPAQIIEIKEPYEEKNWMTTPMIIKMADGSTKEGKLLVKLREIDGVKSCVIVGNCGPQELNYVE